jgi:hypothetical protein
MLLKIKFLIGMSVALSGCMGIISENKSYPEPQSISDRGNRAITNLEFQGTNNKKALASERHVTRMMAWINISTDHP